MSEMRDVVIIGAGCSGWTSAIYMGRAGLEPLVITGMEQGGQLAKTTTVENYPGFPEGVLGAELMERMEAQARKFGTEVRMEWVTEVDFSKKPLMITTNANTYYAKSVIISTGSSPRRLDVKGENELWGFDVSACATCDGPLYRGKTAAVIGGGDTAAEMATFLTRFADKIYLVHRRDRLRASAAMAEKVANNPKIECVWNSVVDECVATPGEGNRPATLHHLVLRDVNTNATSDLVVNGMFLGIGHQPNTEFLGDAVTLDAHGYVITDEFQRTNVDGVFAAGDVQDHTWQQAVTAAGTGCAAALAAEKFLQGLAGNVYPDERRAGILESGS